MASDPTVLFEAHRDGLRSLAYHMLGEREPARDLVQDAYLRWHEVDPETVDDPEAYLRTIVARLAIDRLRAAREEREQYTGPWLPEPVATDTPAPDDGLELETRLSLGVLYLLERLNPVERAVFLLREVFESSYRQVAEVIEKSEANCRQIARRARERVRRSDRRREPSPEEKEELLEAFLAAANEGDMDRLLELLEEDAVHYSDGGDRVLAARAPVTGRVRIARFLTGLADQVYDGHRLVPAEINGEPGVLVFLEGRLHSAWTFEITRRGVRRSFAVLNPAKLPEVAPPTPGTRRPPG